MHLTRTCKIAYAVLAAIVALGLGAYVYQLVGGLGVTGMSNGTSWGLYIASFMFLEGLGAGALAVASAATVFRVSAWRAAVPPAVLAALVCMCLAGVLVLVDLGGIARILNMAVSFNPASPLFWDVCLVTCFLAVCAAFLYAIFSKRGGASAQMMVARVALPVSVLVPSATAWLFGLQIAREGWYSSIMAPLFVASALDSGLALLLLALVWMNRSRVLAASRELVAGLAGLLAVFVAVDGYMVGCEVLTMAYPGTEQGLALLAEMTAGSMAPFFWTEVVVGVLVPFCLLAFARIRRRTGAVVLASAGVLVGVFCKRIWLLLASFVHPNVSGAPGLISGSSSTQGLEGAGGWAVSSSYVPTLPEVLVVAGVLALGVLAFAVLARRFLACDPALDASAGCGRQRSERAHDAPGCEGARIEGAGGGATFAVPAPAPVREDAFAVSPSADEGRPR